MKLNILFVIGLIITVMTASMCTSCKKGESERVVQQGEDTYAGITISLPMEIVTSRALVGGISEESNISTVKVGTWSDGNLAVVYTTINSSELIPDGNGNYTVSKAIKAKTGKNNIIVIANSSEELTVNQVNGVAFRRTVNEIATNDNFVMYSREIKSLANVRLASKEDVENALPGSDLYKFNRTSVILRRAAAKVEVSSSLATTDGTGVLDALGNGKLYDIKWNIANQNSLMTAIVNKLDKSGAFEVKNVNSPFSKILNATPTLTLPKNGDAATFAYCLENSNGLDIYTMSNATAVHVEATFCLGAGKYVDKIITGATVEEFTPNIAMTDMVKGTTFYVSKRAFGVIPAGTFLRAAAVITLQSIFGEQASYTNFNEYRNGLCHWPIYIHDGTSMPNYGVLRNHIYEMNIKSIKAPGLTKFPDIDTPISTNTYIQVDLSVKEWTDSNMGSVEM